MADDDYFVASVTNNNRLDVVGPCVMCVAINGGLLLFFFFFILFLKICQSMHRYRFMRPPTPVRYRHMRGCDSDFLFFLLSFFLFFFSFSLSLLHDSYNFSQLQLSALQGAQRMEATAIVSPPTTRLHGARTTWAVVALGSRTRRPCLSITASLLSSSSSLTEPRRTSFKYARRPQHIEMQQPFFIHEKLHGVFSNERNIGKARRGLPYITPLYTKHMNLWETDTDASTNRFFRSYVFGQRELHQLLGRTHGFEAKEVGGQQALSRYEAETDQRFLGLSTPAFRNIHFEPEWHYTLYAHQAHQAASTAARNVPNEFARPPTKEEILGPQLTQIGPSCLSLEHCKAWFDRLDYLIKLHYDAVGDIGPYKSRHTQHVHRFFTAFHEAISGFDFQDAYLLEHFHAARPASLTDLFGVFIEMEANYVDLAHCPRCSLPYATTRYCGEGDEQTPYRRHRGRWAPHQQWGKEWFDVVARRAEALWYRATEDPFFGAPHHTQRQVEALLRVYDRTQQRAKAIDFMHRLRCSIEFLTGAISITPEMKSTFDQLLDRTPHAHLLTNGHRLHSKASVYTGELKAVSHSPLQLLLDMKLNMFRRQQREEGVIRLPPATWTINTSAIVPYRVNPNTQQVENWREVKEGIEKAFLDAGLPRQAYTDTEWQHRCYWQAVVESKGSRHAALEAERRKEEEEAIQKAKQSMSAGGGSPYAWCLFPTAHWYQVFDTSPSALEPFVLPGAPGSSGKAAEGGVVASGECIVLGTAALRHPDRVPYHGKCAMAKGNGPLILDMRPEASRWFSEEDLVPGEVLRIAAIPSSTGGAAADESIDVVVVGVGKKPSGASALFAMALRPALHEEVGLICLGENVDEVRKAVYGPAATPSTAVATPGEGGLGRQYRLHPIPFLDALRQKAIATVEEEGEAQVIGVRRGQLYVQWRRLPGGGGGVLDRSVAVNLGSPEMLKANYYIKSRLGAPAALQEPPSWFVPFRNDHAEKSLKEAVEAPFKREKWVSMIAGKYTPKVKRFGYTQHTAQDDFHTSEYADRLLSRQFFHHPQMFEVLPERRETSVRFGGKWEGQRVCGLPSVDRNELENGYPEQAFAIGPAEEAVVEQAIRDISGERPGNYIKRPSETQQLQLNESWWTPLRYGWQEQNRYQQAFLPRLEQGLVDGRNLPFQGTVPPFGTTYGIGERIRDIIRDYSKGFGLGPSGATSSADLVQPGGGLDEHRREEAERRSRTLGMRSALLRLFEEKFSKDPCAGDMLLWGLTHAGNGGGGAPDTAFPIKPLLLSLEAWREKGAAPSALLKQFLSVYLKDELTLFNNGLPAGVPQLSLSTDGVSENEAENEGNIWLEVDQRAFRYQKCAEQQEESGGGLEGSESMGFILRLVCRAATAGCGSDPSVVSTGSQYADDRLRGAFLDKIVTDALMALSRVVGKGVPSTAGNSTSTAGRGQVGRRVAAATVTPMLLGSALDGVLERFNVSAEDRSALQRALRRYPEICSPLTHATTGAGEGDVVIPLPALLSWEGPHTSVSPKLRPNRAIGGLQNIRRGAKKSSAAHPSGSGGNEAITIPRVLQDFAVRHDGLYMDLTYSMKENLSNKVLQEEFMQAFLPVYTDRALTLQRFEAYTTGRFVPSLSDAIRAFVEFLVAYAKQPEAGAAPAVPYFDLNSTASPRVLLLPPELGAFRFENTLLEAVETNRLFEHYRIVSGPNAAPLVYFLASGHRTQTYTTHGQEEVTLLVENPLSYVELQKAVGRHEKVLASCALLAPLLRQSKLLVLNFHRFFYRVMPLLPVYRQLLGTYQTIVQTRQQAQEESSRGLTHLFEAEWNASMEAEFKRNSERYWQKVLEGRRVDGSEPFGGVGDSQDGFMKGFQKGNARGYTTSAAQLSGSSAGGKSSERNAGGTRSSTTTSSNSTSSSRAVDPLKEALGISSSKANSTNVAKPSPSHQGEKSAPQSNQRVSNNKSRKPSSSRTNSSTTSKNVADLLNAVGRRKKK